MLMMLGIVGLVMLEVGFKIAGKVELMMRLMRGGLFRHRRNVAMMLLMMLGLGFGMLMMREVCFEIGGKRGGVGICRKGGCCCS